MEFSIIEGKLFNSLNYLSDGYRYTKNRESNGNIYLRCTLAKQCNYLGFAKITAKRYLLDVTKAHNHSRSEYMPDSIVQANTLPYQRYSYTLK